MICVSVLRQLDWGKTKIDQGVWEEDAQRSMDVLTLLQQ